MAVTWVGSLGLVRGSTSCSHRRGEEQTEEARLRGHRADSYRFGWAHALDHDHSRAGGGTLRANECTSRGLRAADPFRHGRGYLIPRSWMCLRRIATRTKARPRP